MAFKCNKCWSSIAKSGYVTTCSHMFCFKCSKDWFSNNEECPTCGHVLKSEGDLRPVRLDRIDLAPLGMMLWGLSPTQSELSQSHGTNMFARRDARARG